MNYKASVSTADINVGRTSSTEKEGTGFIGVLDFFKRLIYKIYFFVQNEMV